MPITYSDYDNVVVKNDKRVSHTRGLFRWHIVQENLNSWKRRYFADLRFQALNDNLKFFFYLQIMIASVKNSGFFIKLIVGFSRGPVN